MKHIVFILQSGTQVGYTEYTGLAHPSTQDEHRLRLFAEHYMKYDGLVKEFTIENVEAEQTQGVGK